MPYNSRPGPVRSIKLLLFLLDVGGIALAYWLIGTLRIPGSSAGTFPMPLWSLVSFFFFNWICLYLLSLYDLESPAPLWLKPLQTLGAALFAGSLLILWSYVMGTTQEFSVYVGGRSVLIGAQVVFAMFAATHRFWFSKWLRTLMLRSRWLVLGNQKSIEPLIADMKQNRFVGFVGILGAPGETITLNGDSTLASGNLQFSHLGSWDSLPHFQDQHWNGVICAQDELPDNLVESLMQMRFNRIRIYDLAEFYEIMWYKVPVHYLRHTWFALAQGFHLLHNPMGLRIKRLGDIVCSLILLIIASPILLLAALAVKLESPGPIVFKQTRVGENGKLFTVYKLRSMRNDAEKNGAQWAQKNDARVTRVGAFLRATRIDELPQLFNVINGEMSFIGPRPERPEFTVLLEKEIPFYGLRHILKPGVTGWAQVMYAYGASVEDAKEKLQYELFYIKNYSLLLDVAIILKTVRIVLLGKGR